MKEHPRLVELARQLKKDNQDEYDRMDRNLRVYEGKIWNTADTEFTLSDRPEGRSEVQFNTVFANIEQTAPLITASRPIATVVPYFPFLERLGVVYNDILRYLWSALDVQNFLYRWAKASMIFGVGIARCLHDPKRGGEIDLSLQDPRRFALAPGYDEIARAPFTLSWNRKPLSWVHSTFPHIKQVVPDSATEETGAYKFGDVSETQAHTDFVTVYELWTRDDEAYEEVSGVSQKKYPFGKQCFYTEHQMLGTIPFTDRHTGPPFVELHDYTRPGNFLSFSEVDQTIGLHREINRLLKYISEYVKKYHDPNYLVDISQLADESYEAVLERLQEGGVHIPWDSTGGKVAPVAQITDGRLNDMVLPYMTFLMQLVDTVSGVTDVNRGMVGKKERQSASELAMLKESGDTRTNRRTANLEWSVSRLAKMMLEIVQQHYTEPRFMSYESDGGRKYIEYGNSFAQADDIMRPQPMSEQAQFAVENNIPLSEQNQAEVKRYQQEVDDYNKFLEVFRDNGEAVSEYDPIEWGFSVEVQSDSTLPTDKQSRANLFLRLRQMKSMDVRSLLESLQVPDVETKVKRIEAEANGGEQMQKVMAAIQQKGGQR